MRGEAAATLCLAEQAADQHIPRALVANAWAGKQAIITPKTTSPSKCATRQLTMGTDDDSLHVIPQFRLAGNLRISTCM